MAYTNRYLEHLKNKEREAQQAAAEKVRQTEAERVKQEFLGATRQTDEDNRLTVLRYMLGYRKVYMFMRRVLPPDMFNRRYPELSK